MESVRTREDATNDTELETVRSPRDGQWLDHYLRLGCPRPLATFRSSVSREIWSKYLCPAAIMSGDRGQDQNRNRARKSRHKKRNLVERERDNALRLGFCYLQSQSARKCIHFMTLFFCVHHRKLFFTSRIAGEPESSEVQRNCNKHSDLICPDWWLEFPNSLCPRSSAIKESETSRPGDKETKN